MRLFNKTHCLSHFAWIIFFLPIFFGHSYAFEVGKTDTGQNIFWTNDSVSYVINTNDGPDDSLDAILKAMETWTDVSTSSFTFTDDGTTSSNDHGIADDVNLIDFGLIDDKGVVGQNSYWINFLGRMVDSDIRLNTKEKWATDKTENAFDVQSIVTHELGHTLSLTDLYKGKDSKKTMYWQGNPGEIFMRTLHQDDKDGIAYLYPSEYNSHIKGFITGETGEPLESVKIKLKKGEKTKKKVKSDENRYYEFINLTSGVYKIIVQKSGYKKVTTTIDLEEATTIDISIEMQKKL